MGKKDISDWNGTEHSQETSVSQKLVEENCFDFQFRQEFWIATEDEDRVPMYLSVGAIDFQPSTLEKRYLLDNPIENGI